MGLILLVSGVAMAVRTLCVTGVSRGAKSSWVLRFRARLTLGTRRRILFIPQVCIFEAILSVSNGIEGDWLVFAALSVVMIISLCVLTSLVLIRGVVVRATVAVQYLGPVMAPEVVTRACCLGSLGRLQAYAFVRLALQHSCYVSGLRNWKLVLRLIIGADSVLVHRVDRERGNVTNMKLMLMLLGLKAAILRLVRAVMRGRSVLMARFVEVPVYI